MVELQKQGKAIIMISSEMAELLGVHINTYQKWERNPKIMDVCHAQKLAEIFEVDINDIDFTKGAA